MRALNVAIPVLLIFTAVPSAAQMVRRDFPTVDAKTQAGRDADRQAILQGELKDEEHKLDAANKALIEAKARRLPAAEVAEAEAKVRRHEQNVAVLKRELTGAVSASEKKPGITDAKARESELSNVSRLARTQGTERPTSTWDTWGRSAAAKSQAQTKGSETADTPVVLRATSSK